MAATERDDAYVPETGTLGVDVLGGAGGGLLAGVLMGLLMHYRMGIMEVVGGLYTLESVAAGWTFHLIHAVLFGLAFSLALRSRAFGKYDFGPVAVTFLGLAWGVALWMVAAGVVMPTWMDAMRLSAPAIPNWGHQSGIGHLVYGLTLGVVVAGARELGG